MYPIIMCYIPIFYGIKENVFLEKNMLYLLVLSNPELH